MACIALGLFLFYALLGICLRPKEIEAAKDVDEYNLLKADDKDKIAIVTFSQDGKHNINISSMGESSDNINRSTMGISES